MKNKNSLKVNSQDQNINKSHIDQGQSINIFKNKKLLIFFTQKIVYLI